MKAYVITMLGHDVSESASDKCIQSHEKLKNDFSIEKFKATTSLEAEADLQVRGLKWNFPWRQPELDIATGLVKVPYATRDPRKRIACSISHYRLWSQCAQSDEPFLILEHDAIFIHRLDPGYILSSNFNIIGINDPIGATRKAKEFSDLVQRARDAIQVPPPIDQFNVPQGLAGNSAYIIKPEGAKNMLNLVQSYGLWPNDAIMCRQLVKRLGVTKTYYTRVQRTESTTVN